MESTTKNKYKIKTEQFEGPLDLLLTLVEKEKVDIIKVQLSEVTDQFIQHIQKLEHVMELQDLADYLVIASQLLVIKSRALLPILEPPEEEEIDEMQLKWRLLEYKKFRKAGVVIGKMLGKKMATFERQIFAEEKKMFLPPPDLKANSLSETFSDILAKMPVDEILDEKRMTEVVTLDQKIEQIRQNVATTSRLSFSEVLDSAKSKTEIVVSFLAMLELLKQKMITVEQDELFGNIEVKKYEQPEENTQ